jgi:DNA mismatch repair protein MutS
MRQYRSLKEQYGDYLLLFRMGDFYEMFYDDAKTASRVLGLALTARSKGPTAVPLAGIPYHALEGYLSRLIKAGLRVAICEQVEDPKLAKGLVKRDVVRLITPGTITEPELLEQREGNFLAAVFAGAGAQHPTPQAGIAWVELSSGAFWAMLTSPQHVLDELVRIRPSEVLLAEGSSQDSQQFRENLRQLAGATPTSRAPWSFDARSSLETLHRHFGVATLEGMGFGGHDVSLSAAGALIEYLRETQKTALGHIRSLRRFDRSDYLVLDAGTLRCLEVHRTLRGNRREGSLLECLDETVTGLGARLLERWLTFPLASYSAILARQDAVEELMAEPSRLAGLRQAMGDTSQIDRIAANIALGRVRPRELVALGQTLRALPELSQAIAGARSDALVAIAPALEGLQGPCDLIAAAIDPDCPNTIRDGGVIAKGFDEDLDRLRRVGADGQSWLASYQSQQAQRLGIPALKVGYNQVFGYYIEVTNVHAQKVPADYVRKQTLKNAERYITDDLKRYESEALTADERAKKREAALFEQVRGALAEHIAAFQAAAEAIATLDVLASMAFLALRRGYVRPAITQEPVLRIVAGKHPVLAQQLGEKFVPNDLEMDTKDNRLLIVTGPNMAGKSTYIRQAALVTLMAHTGCFIPAKEAVVGLCDRIFTRVGAADELTRGLSTFMLEMVETANILHNATRRSLVILDEVGRGTSTYDGLSLAWAISEHLALRTCCRTLFATHYHELTELENVLDGTVNLNVAVREWGEDVIFLHTIARGGADRSYGIHVARLAGVPREVLERAKAILPHLQEHLASGLDMPALAARAKAAAAQMQLFADAPSRLAREIKGLDLAAMTPQQALETLRRLKAEL